MDKRSDDKCMRIYSDAITDSCFAAIGVASNRDRHFGAKKISAMYQQ
jgi:hypothetical protein